MPQAASDITVSDISVSFQDRRVLNNLSLQAHEKRIAIVGRNGSGKSTLLRVMAGLIAPDSGTVSLNGVDVVSDRKEAIKTVGMLFQNPDHQIIFPTVEEEIAFGLRQLGHAKADADRLTQDWLDRFHRKDWAQRPVATLSQGQRHLVCLIAVLAMQPAIILMDEPFSGLDLPTVAGLQSVLSGVDQTLVHVTHAPSEVADYDRVIWIEDGQIALDGTPDQVLPAYVQAMTEVTDVFADLPS